MIINVGMDFMSKTVSNIQMYSIMYDTSKSTVSLRFNMGEYDIRQTNTTRVSLIGLLKHGYKQFLIYINIRIIGKGKLFLTFLENKTKKKRSERKIKYLAP